MTTKELPSARSQEREIPRWVFPDGRESPIYRPVADILADVPGMIDRKIMTDEAAQGLENYIQKVLDVLINVTEMGEATRAHFGVTDEERIVEFSAIESILEAIGDKSASRRFNELWKDATRTAIFQRPDEFEMEDFEGEQGH